MQKSFSKSAKRSTGPVRVVLTVTKFNDVLTDTCATEYVMQLARNDRRVRIKDDNISIAPPGATIQFTLKSGPRDKDTYYPLGISYVRDGNRNISENLKLGFLNFPQAKLKIDKQTLTVTDSYRDREKGVRYKFSVFVQRGSDGKTGIIDPGMIHENSAH